MLSLTKRLQTLTSTFLRTSTLHMRHVTTEPRQRRQSKSRAFTAKKPNEKSSEWWIVDGEMHEIGDHVPPRERFVVPRDNIPNRRRKQLREQFMRRTRLVLKETEHEPWCKMYMELYVELRENWERLYWDEGYSKKIAQDHANYDSAEDDDRDFNPYRTRQTEQMKDQGFGRDRQGGMRENASQLRDKFEYDREKRMREKAFAPMNQGTFSEPHLNSRNRPFDTERYFSSDSD